MSNKSQFFIGELSSKTGLSRDTLRFYEKQGILRAHRLSNNYRTYSINDITRLQFVETARASGFSLRETKQILNLVQMGRKSCSDYETVAHSKLRDLDEKIAALQACRDALAKSLKCCKRDGAQCASLLGI